MSQVSGWLLLVAACWSAGVCAEEALRVSPRVDSQAGGLSVSHPNLPGAPSTSAPARACWTATEVVLAEAQKPPLAPAHRPVGRSLACWQH
jgi:hypothetical protein